MRRSVTLPLRPDELWPALTEPERASRWLGGRLEWQVVEGAPLRFAEDDGTSRSGRVGRIDPGRSLSWTWWPTGEGDAATEVTWTVEPDGEGSTLTVTEEPADAPVPAASLRRAPTRWSADDDVALGAWAGACLVATA